MIHTVLEKIEKNSITISQWIIGFIGIIFIRFILESLSNPTQSGIIPSDTYTLVHYGLFFLTTLLSIILVVGYFTKDYRSISKLVLFGLPIIWLGPIVDIIASSGKGYAMAYIFASRESLLIDFLTFFGPDITQGATIGIRVEIIIVILGIGWYVWLKRKNVVQSIFAVFVSYTAIFMIASIPGLIYTVAYLFTESKAGLAPTSLHYLAQVIGESNIVHNTIHGTLSFGSQLRMFEIGFNKLMSQIHLIIALVFTLLLFLKIYFEKFVAVVKNSRPERMGFYLLLLIAGLGYAYLDGYGRVSSWVDILGIMSLLFGWIGAWLFSVHMNDREDVAIDKISNMGRPLVKKILTKEEMRQSGYIWLSFALIGSWSAGYYPFFMNLVFIAAYFIYSVSPLRLKRVPVLSSFLISVACLVTVLAGFFFASVDKKLGAFPLFTALGILVVFTLITNVRDVKDSEGDKKAGIWTLPVLFKKNGTRIVGALFALGVLLIPVFLSFYTLYIIALPSAVIGYRIITKNPYRDRNVFILGLVFFILTALMVIGIYALARKFGLH